VKLSLSLGEECGLRELGRELLRRTLVHKKGEVTGGWEMLYNDELCNLYSSPVIVT
jgi:hypothetical protein